MSGGSRVDTLKGTSENATDPRRRRKYTYLVPGRGTVDTHRFADITITRLEDAIVVVSRHVPVALDERYQGPSICDNIHRSSKKRSTYTHNVVDMLAVSGSFRADARPDAELPRAHEVGPLVELLSGAKDVAVNETADGVAVAVGAMIVELASVVAGGDVDLGEVTLAGDLDVLGRLHEVDAVERVLGHHAGAVAGLGAVGDHLSLSVTDYLDSGRSPQAEVIDAIEPCTIAH